MLSINKEIIIVIILAKLKFGTKYNKHAVITEEIKYSKNETEEHIIVTISEYPKLIFNNLPTIKLYKE